MESQSLLFQVKSPSSLSCCIKNEQPKKVREENLRNRFRSLTAKRMMPRRLLLQFMGFSPLIAIAQPDFAATGPMLEMKEPEVIRSHLGSFVSVFEVSRTLKLPNGVRFQEILEGEGPKASEGNRVEINYVCRRSNGYFVHSTVDQFSGESSPVILPLDENEIIKGLKDVIVGMRVGGKRRALIPPSVGYINENLQPIPQEFGPRRSLMSHMNEPLIFEVQLLKLL
ncbi:peptidyl-prolyl cis-trans isomerase FKBP16-1, chloroplastic isoform X1 [Cannabis sativa]|uniref:peptidyl-prolyl cis-trans isomerase FKBP16-1, chloroplastic isoform X1 n=1 Tax=Cannabis sativa TaxID=3483 RepID=UPI0029CA57C1|nr:peptidyl-prolyl cis-trans isomerase FKBP16-1, chloroplastic isoform X1 [Cannabis sativa]